MLQYALDPSVYLDGCSAGVYALLGAHLSNLIVVISLINFPCYLKFS